MESVDPQNQSTEQNENTAAENAAQAPTVATGGADNAPTPDPSQLAADGDAVVGGLEENHTNPVTPNESQ